MTAAFAGCGVGALCGFLVALLLKSRLPGIFRRGGLERLARIPKVAELRELLRKARAEGAEKDERIELMAEEADSYNAALAEDSWPWAPYVPPRGVTVLGGGPGVGKTRACAEIAVRAARNGWDVRVWTADPETFCRWITSVVALLAAPVLNRISIEGSEPFKIGCPLDTDGDGDCPFHRRGCPPPGRTLAILDEAPASRFGARASLYRANRLGVPVVLSVHRDRGEWPGGEAFLAGARSALVLDRDGRLMHHIKCNHGPIGPSWRLLPEPLPF